VSSDVDSSYDADIAAAARVATETMEACEAVNDTSPPDVVRQCSGDSPVVLRQCSGDSPVVLRLRYWIQPPTIQRTWNAQNAVTEAVEAAFEREGTRVPLPQRELSNRPRAEDGGTA